MKLSLLLFTLLVISSYPQNEIMEASIDKRYVNAFNHIIDSKTLNDLWNEYDSPPIQEIPIIVNPKTYDIDLIAFKEEIINNNICTKNISEYLIDSLYLDSTIDSTSLKYRPELGQIEKLSNIPLNGFKKINNVLVIIFTKPFRNLIIAYLFHSNSMDGIDANWVFGSGYELLFCFDEKNQISKVFTKHVAYN